MRGQLMHKFRLRAPNQDLQNRLDETVVRNSGIMEHGSSGLILPISWKLRRKEGQIEAQETLSNFQQTRCTRKCDKLKR
jgi:hypothetical protein